MNKDILFICLHLFVDLKYFCTFLSPEDLRSSYKQQVGSHGEDPPLQGGGDFSDPSPAHIYSSSFCSFCSREQPIPQEYNLVGPFRLQQQALRCREHCWHPTQFYCSRGVVGPVLIASAYSLPSGSLRPLSKLTNASKRKHPANFKCLENPLVCSEG